MPYTETLIANMALSRLGISQQLIALTDNTPEGRLASLWMQPLREMVLREWPWPFAAGRAVLALVEEDPTEEWAYAYRTPTDCLRAVRIVLAQGARNESQPFEMGSDGAGGLIYTDADDAVLLYTRAVTDPSRWSPDFGNALAWRLAMEMGPALSINASLTQLATVNYRQAIMSARAMASNEGRPDEPDDSSFIKARL